MEFVIIACFHVKRAKHQISARPVLKIISSTMKQVHALKYAHLDMHNISINVFHVLLNANFVKLLQIIAYRVLADIINMKMEAVCKVVIIINTLILLKELVKNVLLHAYHASQAHSA